MTPNDLVTRLTLIRKVCQAQSVSLNASAEQSGFLPRPDREGRAGVQPDVGPDPRKLQEAEGPRRQLSRCSTQTVR